VPRAGRGVPALGLSASLIAIAIAAVALPVSASAATIDVTVRSDHVANNGNGCALREAIRSANLNVAIGNCAAGAPGADKIRVKSGTYPLTIAGLDATATQGDLDITDSVQVIGKGKGFTVDGGGNPGIGDRVFELHGTSRATIRNAVIRGGRTVAGEDGGGIRAPAETVLRLVDSTLRANAATGPGAFAGAIDSDGILRLTDVLVAGNEAPFVGAINSGSVATMRRVTVRGNEAPFAGAGIRTVDDLLIADSTISGNYLRDGGGVHNGGGLSVNAGEVVLRNTTVSGNRSDQGGGGIAVTGGGLFLIHSTIAANRADSDAGGQPGNGGGILRTAGNVDLRGTVIANNVDASPANPVYRDCAGIVDSFGFNLIRRSTGCAIFQLGDPDLPALTNPKLKPLRANGGPTKTHALGASSPLVDRIPKAKCHEGGGVDPKPVKRDQRGVKRPQGNRCDIGAYERR
jgi:hypothetical protein